MTGNGIPGLRVRLIPWHYSFPRCPVRVILLESPPGISSWSPASSGHSSGGDLDADPEAGMWDTGKGGEDPPGWCQLCPSPFDLLPLGLLWCPVEQREGSEVMELSPRRQRFPRILCLECGKNTWENGLIPRKSAMG